MNSNETKAELNNNLTHVVALKGIVSDSLLSLTAGELIVDYYINYLKNREDQVCRQLIVDKTNLILQEYNIQPLSYSFFRKFNFKQWYALPPRIKIGLCVWINRPSVGTLRVPKLQNGVELLLIYII